jgi:hypothetical protein
MKWIDAVRAFEPTAKCPLEISERYTLFPEVG